MTRRFEHDDFIGERAVRFGTIGTAWSTIDPDSPPSEGALPFSLLDQDRAIIPNSEGWATPYDGTAYDLGSTTYTGEFWGFRLSNTGYIFRVDRQIDKTRRTLKGKKLKHPYDTVRVRPTTAPA